MEKEARQAVREHAELSVLQWSLSRHDSRFTNLEQWSDDIAEAINDVKDRVTILEQYCWWWVGRRPKAGYSGVALSGGALSRRARGDPLCMTSGVGLVAQFDVDSELWKSDVGLRR